MTLTGWLINDCLTTIPGTKTFWHDLLEWIPNLKDMTGGYTNFNLLADKIENEARVRSPAYIVRNATFFRPLKIHTKQIVFLQDCYDGDRKLKQLEVCNSADAVVFNSKFIYNKYKHLIFKPSYVFPIGTDFSFFEPMGKEKRYDIIYVGDSKNYPKGFNVIRDLIDNTNYTFALVMKDDFQIEHERITVFNRVDHNALRYIYNSSKILVCTSQIETLHLAGMEAGACNIPLVTSDVGVYREFWDTSGCGIKVKEGNWIHFKKAIEKVFENYHMFEPRNFLLAQGMDKKFCKSSWLNLIEKVTQ